MNRLIVSCLGAVIYAMLPLLPQVSHAQQYPNKPILLVSPYGVGGNADLAARLLGLVAAKYLGQSVVVVNRPGAGGIVGSQFVLDAAKDEIGRAHV